MGRYWFGDRNDLIENDNNCNEESTSIVRYILNAHK